MPRKIIDLISKRFGSLEVICRAPNSRSGAARWHCLCDCGRQSTVWGSSLTRGNTRSCGCLAKAATALRSTTHGGTGDRLHKIWRSMRNRCKFSCVNQYHRYGGRGISVCEEWVESFDAFRSWAMDNGYKTELQIDRINNDGDYSPSNCRWVTVKEQANNRSTSHKIEYNGITKTLTEWAEHFGVNRGTLNWRVKHWGVKKAFSVC